MLQSLPYMTPSRLWWCLGCVGPRQVWVVLAGMMLLTMVGGTVLNWVASSRWFSRPGGDDGGEGGPRTGRAKGVEGGAVFRPSWIIRTIVNEGEPRESGYNSTMSVVVDAL